MSVSKAVWLTARTRDSRWRVFPVLLLGLSLAAYAAAETTPRAAELSSSDFRLIASGASVFPQLGSEVARMAVGEPSFVAVTSVRVAGEFGASINPSALRALRTEIRKNVAATVPLAKIQVEEALTPIEARGRARRARLPLVLFEPTIQSGSLFLQVTVTKWPQKFWRRALTPAGVTTETLRLRVGAGSLRALFPPAQGPIKKRATMKSPLSAPIALSCGDIDEDGQLDLAVVGRHSIVLGALDGANFREKARRTWEGLSNVAGSPLRAPLGSARIENGLLTVGLSDRAETVHLGSNLETAGYSPRGYPLPGGACLSFFADGGMGNKFDCQVPEEVAPSAQVSSEGSGVSMDAYALSTFPTPSGVSGSLTSVLSRGKSEVSLELELPSEQLVRLTLPDTGTALVSGDLDGNGTIEVITSSSSESGAPDRLRIHTLLNKQLQKLAEFETSAISAVAICPFDGSNPLTLVMITGGELWLLK